MNSFGEIYNDDHIASTFSDPDRVVVLKKNSKPQIAVLSGQIKKAVHQKGGSKNSNLLEAQNYEAVPTLTRSTDNFLKIYNIVDELRQYTSDECTTLLDKCSVANLSEFLGIET